VHDSITTFGTVSAPGPLEQNSAMIFGQTVHPIKITTPELRRPRIKDIYSQPNKIFYKDTLRSPDSSVDSRALRSLSVSSISTLPTSEEGDTDTEIEKEMKNGKTPYLTIMPYGDDKQGIPLSLKRSYT
jgi:hypothetical protein